MKEIISGIILGLLVVFFISPYFSLWDLKDLSSIVSELRDIKKEMEKLNEGLRERNRLD